MPCTHYPHEGQSVSRMLYGGPLAGQSVRFYPCQTDMVLVSGGRYVVHEIQQKNRVIKKVLWEEPKRESPAERFARLRGAILHNPGPRLGW